MTARDLHPGDVLRMATGDVVVASIKMDRGGFACVVRPARSKTGAKSTRVLWLWASQGVKVVDRAEVER